MTDSGEIWNSRDEMAGRSLGFVVREAVLCHDLICRRVVHVFEVLFCEMCHLIDAEFDDVNV